jgi:Polysaccharide deacetylase
VDAASNPNDSTPQAQQRLHLLYHELRDGGSSYSYVTDTEMFRRHVELYRRLRAAASTPVLPELTFDDGHISNLTLAAPILEASGLRAHFFITAGWTGSKPGYMGWPDVRALQQAGHSIGAHGWSHKLLTHCTAQELQTELGDARRTLEDNLGVSITTMSLPGGRCNGRVLDACDAAGYSSVYTSVPRAESLPLGNTVGRFNIHGTMQPEWIAKLFVPDSKVLASLQRRYQLKETVKTLLGDSLYAKLWALGNRQEREREDAAG